MQAGPDAPSRDAVDSFIAARRIRPRAPDIPQAHRPHDIASGYRLQGAIHAELERAGTKRHGYKVGSTSKPGQALFGLSEPAYGGMFADNRFADLDAALAADLVAPALECEIAVRLASGLDGRTTLPSRDEVAAAIGACCLGCEVIDRRYADAAAFGVPCLLADDFFHAGFVLGPDNPGWKDLDLTQLEAAIEIDGERFEGKSQDVLDPYEALRWLVGALARSGKVLAAGEIVLTGSLVTPVAIRLPAQSVRLTITGFEPMTAGRNA